MEQKNESQHETGNDHDALGHAHEETVRAEAAHVHGPNCSHSHGHHQSHDPIVRAEAKVGRNDPCPCGSQQKYKKCHGQ
ncbi:MAG: SEC-C domain-containing protein [Chitinophagaceae bacterium]|nr:SEC-C domain-containing protein [Oligoflexus sp.]